MVYVVVRRIRLRRLRVRIRMCVSASSSGILVSMCRVLRMFMGRLLRMLMMCLLPLVSFSCSSSCSY